MTTQAADLIKKLLNLDPEKTLGSYFIMKNKQKNKVVTKNEKKGSFSKKRKKYQ